MEAARAVGRGVRAQLPRRRRQTGVARRLDADQVLISVHKPLQLRSQALTEHLCLQDTFQGK